MTHSVVAASFPVTGELRPLFHQLNNQLGIILAHAELLESKATTEAERRRASQIVTSALDAMMTVRSLRAHHDHADDGRQPS